MRCELNLLTSVADECTATRSRGGSGTEQGSNGDGTNVDHRRTQFFLQGRMHEFSKRGLRPEGLGVEDKTPGRSIGGLEEEARC